MLAGDNLNTTAVVRWELFKTDEGELSLELPVIQLPHRVGFVLTFMK